MKQLTLDDKLFEKERVNLQLMDSLGGLIKSLKYLKVVIEATAGNYDYKSSHHTSLTKAETAMGYVLYWMALMRYRTGNRLKEFEKRTVGDYTNSVVTERNFSLDNVNTPTGLYDIYLRAFSDIERSIKLNQKAIDAIRPLNDLVGYLYSSMQDVGAAIEEIM